MTTLRMTRGDSKAFDLTLVDGDGAALDLTDMQLTFTASRHVWTGAYDADGVWGQTRSELTIEKTEVSGIDVDDDPTTGLATLTIDPADTEDWSDYQVNGPFAWDLELRTLAGEVRTPLSGVLVIKADVTQPVAS